MQFSDVTLRLIIFSLGICGFMVAKHIRNHKTKNTSLVCPIGFDCHAVVHSDYSKFFGMPVEFLGMIYYAFISIFSLLLILLPLSGLTFALLAFAVIPICLIAFLFSLYLISLQIFILRKGCSWCIGSALISALIFILTVVK